MSARIETRAGFACPACRRAGALGIVRRLVLPGDRRADEIALEILACACGAKALAVTEQLQMPAATPAALKANAGERMGFRLAPAAVDLIAYLMAQCPDPAEEYCTCPAHAALDRRDLRNGWNLLHSFAPVAGFGLAPVAGNAPAAPPAYDYAPLTWIENGEGFRATVEGREWRLFPAQGPDAPAYDLAIGDAIELEIPLWPPFWRKG